jgi:hypothetical protein
MYVLHLPVLSIVSQKDVHPQHLVRESRVRSCHQEKIYILIFCVLHKIKICDIQNASATCTHVLYLTGVTPHVGSDVAHQGAA